MSKKGQRLREFEKNNRDLSFHDSQKERRERHKAIKERKKLKSVDPQELNSLKSSEKKGKKKNKITNVKRFIGGMIILIFVMSIGASAIKIIKLTGERDRLLETNKQLTELKEDLTAEMGQINSAEYIEQQARKELKMIKSGEILFLVDENSNEENGK
ncbi:MAG: septum formation initiator family protein [Anaerovoracaceae bacterium]|nr:septum formation initiator family protein [Bacillota bacterium]MEE0517680.1 septum formation initiator family protein [Anaerovoracaceae bacterium]